MHTVNMFKTTLKALGNENIRKADFKLTSILSLSPQNPIMTKMAETPVADTVKVNSIIGNNKEAGVPGGTDGIVSYSSAHWDKAESELIIRNDHDVHANPYGIREVHRILMKHLEENIH